MKLDPRCGRRPGRETDDAPLAAGAGAAAAAGGGTPLATGAGISLATGARGVEVGDPFGSLRAAALTGGGPWRGAHGAGKVLGSALVIAVLAAVLALVVPSLAAGKKAKDQGKSAPAAGATPQAERAPASETGARASADDASAAGSGASGRLLTQTPEEEARKSAGCLTCHKGIERDTGAVASGSMHASPAVRIGCTDCHGGNAAASAPAGSKPGETGYQAAERRAHVVPRGSGPFRTSANPERTYAALNREDPAFIRFFNPGDLRVAQLTCGVSGCHTEIVQRVRSSMMVHGAMLWGAGVYNNGALPFKDALLGEAYTTDGKSAKLEASPAPSAEETLTRGWLGVLLPLPRYEVGQAANQFRVFERGGKKPLETALADRDEDGGRPARRLSQRGYGTLTRVDPLLLGLQKTRLLDPTLNFLGTNDHPGDYRSSGCTSCHVIYANDSSSVHSGPWAQYGNRGLSASEDAAMSRPALRAEPGHPIKHLLTRSIPSSQCVVCHMHPGTTVLNEYFGTMWWDLETDGDSMYLPGQRYPTPQEEADALDRNPEGSNVRGKWRERSFLEHLEDLNSKLKNVQFAGFAGHGWPFRNVYKRDRKGNLLDGADVRVAADDPERFRKAAHLQDIHLDKGMHCVDCHFEQDNHGTGHLHGEVRAAIEIDCVDCHGTVQRRANLLTSAAAGGGGRSLETGITPFKEKRFYWDNGKLYQRAMLEQGKTWEVVQVRDTVDPDSEWSRAHPAAASQSRLAKTIRRDGQTWGDVPASEQDLAHPNTDMTCFSCHTAWVTSCFGCHLPMKVNRKTPVLHSEGDTTRNYIQYCFQTLRDDIFFLGRDGTVTGQRVAPVRSACAIMVSSQNANREWLYSQQQTLSTEGFSGIAFSSFVPHTVRAAETKRCTDCHVARAGDNNAWMASTLLQGTGLMNFMGRYVYVGEGPADGRSEGKGGFEAVAVTERDEPQAVIGSSLHRLAYPDFYNDHRRRKERLEHAVYHHSEPIRSLQLRGEYLYAASGSEGLVVFDVANVDNKGFSEKAISAPVSPAGQRLYVRTKDAVAVAAPTTMLLDPTRSRLPQNQEGPIHPLYRYIYVLDREEGLVLVDAVPLFDGDPTNNFLTRAATFDAGGALKGGSCLTLAGSTAYVGTEDGLYVLSLDDPLRPRTLEHIAAPAVRHPRALAVQFRYLFVADGDGIKVFDVTAPSKPRLAATLPLAGANDIYLARTYAYVAAGKRGVAVVNIEKPEAPALVGFIDAGGAINDARAVRVGVTNAALFAYVADGVNGLRVIQLASPEDTPEVFGFSPVPRAAKLIATYPTQHAALAVSRGLDRDRAADEGGNQIAVFGRRGARPFNQTEAARMYLRDGALYTVSNDPPGEPRAFAAAPAAGERAARRAASAQKRGPGSR